MQRLLILPALLAALLAAAVPEARAAADAEPVRLHESVVVTGDRVRLGDLFSGTGDKAGIAVAYAPGPGKRATFDAPWLYRVARAYKLGWRPLSLKEQAVVERDSIVIGQAEIKRRLLEALIELGADPEMTVTLSNRLLRLHVAGDVSPTLGLEDLAYRPENGRFSALLVAPAGDPAAQRVRVTGRLHKVREIPVLARRVLSGEIITKADIRWIQVRADRLQPNTVMDAADLIGMAAKRGQRAGKPIRSRDIGRPVLVPKGRQVTLILETPVMLLTVRGRALEDGGDGDIIRVANTHSNTVIQGEVIGSDRIRVRLAGRSTRN